MKEDKVVPMRFCHAMKPTKPDYGERRQTVETFMEFFKEEDFPMLVSKKYDGLNALVTKGGEDKIRIWTEQGQDITSKVPGVVDAFKKLSGDFTLMAELELWEGGKHLPREAVAGQVNRKVPDDSGIVANAYTIIYRNEDIHKLPESERQNHLGKLNLPQATVGVPDVAKRLNAVPNVTARNMAELKRAVSMLSMKVGSEGVVVKKASAPYYLDGNSRNGWAKYHLTSVLSGVVIEAIETKVAGTYNYRYGLEPGGLSIARKNLEEVRDKEYAVAGKTFSSATKFKRGDVIIVEFETFNYTDDERDGTVDVSAWAPRVVGLSGRTTPDSITTVKNRAKQDRVLSYKRIDKESESHFISLLEFYRGIDLARHRKDQCMRCQAPPEFEILWAEGMAHAWLCAKHFEEFAKEHLRQCKEEGFAVDIDSVKRVSDGEVGKKWGDNRNGDIWPEFKAKFNRDLRNLTELLEEHDMTEEEYKELCQV